MTIRPSGITVNGIGTTFDNYLPIVIQFLDNLLL